MVDPKYVEALVEKEISEKLDSHIQERVDHKFDKTLGLWIRRAKWVSLGAAVVVALLSLERLFLDELARPAFNAVSGFDVSFSETLDSKFPDYARSQPFLVSVNNHSAELVYANCDLKVITVPFHFERGKQKVHLFFRFRPYSNSQEKILIKGRINNTGIDDDIFHSPDGREWEIRGRDLTAFAEESATSSVRTRKLIVTIDPTFDSQVTVYSINDLSGTASLRRANGMAANHNSNQSDCVGMGGELEILLKVFGDPRANV